MIFPLSKAILRPWTLDDADSLCKHANNIKIARFLRNGFPHPYTLKDAISWLKSVNENPNLLLAISIEDEAIGGIGLIFKDDIYHKNAEIGYWLSEDFWNQGITTEAIITLSKYAFSNLEIIRIYAGIFETNKASAKVLLKAGFVHEATLKNALIKNGQILNEHIYSLLK